MKHLFYLLLLVIVPFFTSHAQESEGFSSDPRLLTDFTLASIGSGNAVALSLHRMHPIAFKKRFAIGYGIRFTGFYGQDNGFVTAPAKVSEGNFFKKQNEAKLDTLYLAHSSVGSINASIHLEYRFTSRISAEFNIDALGWSFGADRWGRFEALSRNQPITSQSAKVTPLNLLLTGDYDIGSLNSELSLNIHVTDNLLVRPGVSFVFTEFTTHNKLEFNNDRFRKKSLLPMIGVSYRIR